LNGSGRSFGAAFCEALTSAISAADAQVNPAASERWSVSAPCSEAVSAGSGSETEIIVRVSAALALRRGVQSTRLPNVPGRRRRSAHGTPAVVVCSSCHHTTSTPAMRPSLFAPSVSSHGATVRRTPVQLLAQSACSDQVGPSAPRGRDCSRPGEHSEPPRSSETLVGALLDTGPPDARSETSPVRSDRSRCSMRPSVPAVGRWCQSRRSATWPGDRPNRFGRGQ